MGFLFAIWLVCTYIGTRYWENQEMKMLAQVTHRAAIHQLSKAEHEIQRTIFSLKNIPVLLAREQDFLSILESPPHHQLDNKVNTLLSFFQKHFAVDIIWILNAKGTCIASSNALAPNSLVGTNFKERDYFTQAITGQLGKQFAVGKSTNIPGLFFSAPIFNHKNQVVGVVTIKLNIDHLSHIINIPNLFLTDDLGVIILSDPPQFFLKALPTASVFKKEALYRRQRYQQSNLSILPVKSTYLQLDIPYLKKIEGYDTPFVWLESKTFLEGLHLNIVIPIPNFSHVEKNANQLFWFSLFVGLSGIVIIFVLFFFVKKLRFSWIELQLVNAITNRGRNPIYCTYPEDNFRFYYVNDAMCQHYHYAANILIEKNMLDLSTLHHPQENYHLLWKRVKQERKIVFESEHFVGEEKRIVEIALTYLQHHQKEYLMGQIRDITNEKAFRKHLEDLATKDALTQILNRRGFFMLLEEYIIFHEQEIFLSILIFDIDFFKKINDTYGHTIGDCILVETTKRVQTCLPPTALFCRYGGEEFVIALPSVTLELAATLGETIRSTIAACPMFVEGIDVSVTVSVGGTSWCERDDIAMQRTIQRADEALYYAKSHGRNQVSIRPPPTKK